MRLGFSPPLHGGGLGIRIHVVSVIRNIRYLAMELQAGWAGLNMVVEHDVVVVVGVAWWSMLCFTLEEEKGRRKKKRGERIEYEGDGDVWLFLVLLLLLLLLIVILIVTSNDDVLV